MQAATPALRVDGLVRRFGARTALAGLSLEVGPGEVYGFIGPNGAGKTTAIRCILGLSRRDAGTVEIFGERHPVRQRRGVGALVERPGLFGWATARQELRRTAAIHGRGDEAAIEEALEAVGLRERADEPVAGFSTGMRQRLGVARAVLGWPRLVLLDEPTEGLDPRGIRLVRDLLVELRRRGSAVFVSSHLLSEVERVCDRVGIVDRGRLVAEGAPAEIAARAGAEREVEVGAVDRAALARALAALGWAEVVGEAGAGRLLVRLRGRGAAELNRALVEAGVAVDALVPRGAGLEALFLSLTRPQDAVGAGEGA